MGRSLALLAALLFIAAPAHAQKTYDQAELDALLAPIALQPDGVLSHILIATTYPDDVAAAARWSRGNPGLRGDAAVRSVENEPWDPSVKALVAFPELLARMDESPQWMRDLGAAFLGQEAQVMDTVQGLRHRAQAAGQLSNRGQTTVYQDDGAIVVEPRAQVVYVRYYDPYVVYGPWWWPHFRPVFWHPWVARPVVVAHGFFYAKPYWHQRHVHVVHRPVHVQHHANVVPGKWQHRTSHGAPQQPHFTTPALAPRANPALVPQSKPMQVTTRAPRAPHPSTLRVPESQRKPIVQQRMPAASGFSQNKPREGFSQNRQRVMSEPQRQQRAEPQRQQRSGPQRQGQGRGQGSHQRQRG